MKIAPRRRRLVPGEQAQRGLLRPAAGDLLACAVRGTKLEDVRALSPTFLVFVQRFRIHDGSVDPGHARSTPLRTSRTAAMDNPQVLTATVAILVVFIASIVLQPSKLTIPELLIAPAPVELTEPRDRAEAVPEPQAVADLPAHQEDRGVAQHEAVPLRLT